jgi:hypothetical protein
MCFWWFFFFFLLSCVVLCEKRKFFQYIITVFGFCFIFRMHVLKCFFLFLWFFCSLNVTQIDFFFACLWFFFWCKLHFFYIISRAEYLEKSEFADTQTLVWHSSVRPALWIVPAHQICSLIFTQKPMRVITTLWMIW